MPALDRCSVILSSLQGLAEYHEHSPAFDVSISSFIIIVDIIKCIRLICHHLVVWAGEEFQRFNAFSTWMKHIMGVLKADPASQAGEDLYEDDPNIEYHFVLAYIGGSLQKSKLDMFLGTMADAPSLKASKNLYQETKLALDGFKQGKPTTKPEMLSLPSYFLEWCRHNRTLIEQITAWQRSNTIMPGGFVLANGTSRLCDLRMVSEVRY
jgi:anaphase-promoting complex subunit 4